MQFTHLVNLYNSNLYLLKSIFKDTFIYGILSGFTKFFNFLIFFIFINYLSKNDIAKLDLLLVYSSVLTIIISMQLESSFARFYFNFKEKNQEYDLLKTIIFIMILLSFVFFMPTLFLYNILFSKFATSSFFLIFLIIFINALMITMTNLINLSFRYSNERKKFIISSVLFSLTYLLIIVFYVFFLGSFDIILILTAQFLSTLFVLLYQFFIIGKQLYRAQYQSSMVRELFMYSIPMFPMFFLIFANDKAIIYILEVFISLQTLADFTLATKLLAFLSVLFFALRLAFEPRIFRFISHPSDIKKLEFKQFLNLYITISSILFFIFLISIPAIQEYFYPDFSNSGKWTIILAVSLILLNMGTYLTPGFSIKKRMDIKLYIVIIQVLFNFLGFYFILKSGNSVTFSLKYLVFINYTFLLIQHYCSNKLYKVSNEYLKVTVLFLLVFIV